MSTNTPQLPYSVCEPLHLESTLFSQDPFCKYNVSLSLAERQDRSTGQLNTPFVSHGHTAKTDFHSSILAFLIYLQLECQDLISLDAELGSHSQPFESSRVASILNTFAGYQECLRRAWSRLMRALHGNTPPMNPLVAGNPPIQLSLNSLLAPSFWNHPSGIPASHTALQEHPKASTFRNRFIPRSFKSRKTPKRALTLQLSEIISPPSSTPPTIISIYSSVFKDPQETRQYSIN